MKVIPTLKYCKEHTWVKLDGEYAYIGITDYAQDQLAKGEDFGVVESSKVASDLIAPISGEVVEINEVLEDEPEAINEDAYDAWIVKVRISDTDELNELISSDSYEAGLE